MMTTDKNIFKTYRFRAYLNRSQARMAFSWLKTTRMLFNHFLSEWQKGSEKAKQFEKGTPEYKACYPSHYFQSKHIPILKEYFWPELKDVDASVLLASLSKLHEGLDNFRKRHAVGVRPPRFAKREDWNVLTNYQSDRVVLTKNGFLDFGKMKSIKLYMHRQPIGRVRSCELVFDDGKWFAHVTCDNAVGRGLNSTGREVGIDLGCNNFLSTNDGVVVKNPRILEKSARRIAVLNRKLARQEKGSVRREKTKNILKKVYGKIKREREHFSNKWAYRIAKKYDFIGMEDLNLQEMKTKKKGFTQYKNVHKAVNKVAWGRFRDRLAYNLSQMGKNPIIFVPPRGTSQQCSVCQRIVSKRLGEDHSCPCGYKENRDVNAARNILARAKTICGGSAQSGKAVGDREKPGDGKEAREGAVNPSPHCLRTVADHSLTGFTVPLRVSTHSEPPNNLKKRDTRKLKVKCMEHKSLEMQGSKT